MNPRQGPEARHTGRRCPACGQRLAPPIPATCPLCGFGFGEGAITGADVTPYAHSYSHGTGGWRRMNEWVWYAGAGRLKHLALMQASAASRRFFLIHALLISLAAGLFQGTSAGWRQVRTEEMLSDSGSIDPAGEGWLSVARGGGFARRDPSSVPAMELWWNPAQALLAWAIGSVAALLGVWIGARLVTAGVTRAHAPPYREELRMTAALHYSTAWVVPLLVSGFVLLFRPLGRLRTTMGWTGCPPGRWFLLAAAVFAAFGLVMWWFWLVRLGSTAPARTRARVIAFLGLGAPIVAASVVAAWWFGTHFLYDWLFASLSLTF